LGREWHIEGPTWLPSLFGTFVLETKDCFPLYGINKIHSYPPHCIQPKREEQAIILFASFSLAPAFHVPFQK
jgi:hypothetical protein